MTFEEYAEPRVARIDAALDRLLPREDEKPETLHQAMRYSVLSPGKRIRPLLCVAAAEACGGSAETVLPTACALECIHAFSLIHDDLPALDNDDLRRGRPTCHVRFGEAMAILAGDALFAHAFRLIAANVETADAAAVVRVLDLISKASATSGMVGGQVVDLQAEGAEPDRDTVAYIHDHKTAALIRASVEAGAVLAGAGPEAPATLGEYGSTIGRAFQEMDDLLNALGDPGSLGKPVGSDAERGKATFVALLGVDECRRRVDALRDSALALLAGWGGEAEPLRAIARYIADRAV